MLGYIRTSDTNQTGLRCPYTPHPASYPRISWPKRVQTVWLQWSFQPWHHLWISHSRVIGPYVICELCGTGLCNLILLIPVYVIGLYLNTSHILVVWHRSVPSKFAIYNIWNRSVLK